MAYAGSEKAAEDVGFYYAANAAGRLVGILLSGILAQTGGTQACLWGSAAMLVICLAVTFLLPATSQACRGDADGQRYGGLTPTGLGVIPTPARLD
ncbi:MAG: hypothetical protein ACJ8AW_34345 [Rhodopila sp.]